MNWYKKAQTEGAGPNFDYDRGVTYHDGVVDVRFKIDNDIWEYIVSEDVAQKIDQTYVAMLKKGNERSIAAREAYANNIPKEKKSEVRIGSDNRPIESTRKWFDDKVETENEQEVFEQGTLEGF
jgi:hypothetical protein